MQKKRIIRNNARIAKLHGTRARNVNVVINDYDEHTARWKIINPMVVLIQT